MKQQQKLEDSEFAPSFNCYSSDSTTSTAIAKVIREEQLPPFPDYGDVEGEEFEFSLSDEEVLVQETVFPVFDVNILVKGEIESTDDEIDASSAIRGPLRKLFIGERDESSSYSSSEVDESESPRSISKCKKSSSTGSRSKRWIFRYLLRRSNSEGKEKMVDSRKQKRNSGVLWKVQTPVHEQFYVQRRAENEAGKRKTYLPYRKDLVGVFANVNGMGKMLPF